MAFCLLGTKPLLNQLLSIEPLRTCFNKIWIKNGKNNVEEIHLEFRLQNVGNFVLPSMQCVIDRFPAKLLINYGNYTPKDTFIYWPIKIHFTGNELSNISLPFCNVCSPFNSDINLSAT